MSIKDQHIQLRKEIRVVGKKITRDLKRADKNLNKSLQFYKAISL